MSTPFGTPPAPPPKPSTSVQAPATPSLPGQRAPPPIPGTPPHGTTADGANIIQNLEQIQGPEEGWLPEILLDKSTSDLQALLSSPELQHALIHAPQSAHASIPNSTTHLANLLATNISLATQLTRTEHRLAEARQDTQSRLLALRGSERQWKQKQTEQDSALREFSASVMYQRLVAAVGEQQALCKTIEEDFLEEDGTAGEREVSDYVRRVKEARKVEYLRRERKERWDEGRVGGWRG